MRTNKVTLIGNLGTDPESQTLQSGTKMVKFRFATSEFFKDKSGNRQELTEWHNIVIWWQQLAEQAEKFLHKGSYVYLEGRLRTRTYDDKDGKKIYRTEIVADSFLMLQPKPTNGESAAQTTQVTEMPEDAVDDLPF